MRNLFWWCAAVIVCAGAASWGGALAVEAASGAKEGEEPASDEQPLLLTEEPLLLLGDETPLLLGDTQPLDDGLNARCHVCHMNFAMEEIAVTHAKEEIGCADCHGDCDAHIDDESWADGGPGTPPGIMYPRDRIDTACGECHDMHDVPARDVLARLMERCPERTDPKTVVCTDCHGHHRLKPELRNAWWDKRTGKPTGPPKKKTLGKEDG